MRLGDGEMPQGADLVIDCRGLAAKDDLPTLRGVRGERIVIRSREVDLARPVRLLHPRFPLYVVPWGDGLYMIGATVIESEETGAITLRSALDLLSAAYALDPAFAEAEIVRQGAGARPAFPDNRPRIIPRNGYIFVNGLYRHGFLLAPASGRAGRRLYRNRRDAPGGVSCRSCSTVRLTPPTQRRSTSFARGSASPRRRSPPP